MTNDELREAVAKQLADALKADCVGPDGKCYAYTDEGICQQEGIWCAEVDGEFDLLVLADAILPRITELEAENARLREAFNFANLSSIRAVHPDYNAVVFMIHKDINWHAALEQEK